MSSCNSWIIGLLKIAKIILDKDASGSWILLAPLTHLYWLSTLLFDTWLIFLNILYVMTVKRTIVWPIMIHEFHKGNPYRRNLLDDILEFFDATSWRNLKSHWVCSSEEVTWKIALSWYFSHVVVIKNCIMSRSDGVSK